MTTKVYLIDDHALVRAGLKMILAGEFDIEVVGEADNGEDALLMTAELKPGYRDEMRRLFEARINGPSNVMGEP